MEAERYVSTRRGIRRFWNTTIRSNETKQRDVVESDRYFLTRRNSSNETKDQTLWGQNGTFQRDETARRFGVRPVLSNETKQRDVLGSDRYFPTRRNSSNETKHQTLLEQKDTFQQDETARRVFVCVDRLVLSNETKHQTPLEQKDTFQQDKTARRFFFLFFF